MSLLPFDLLAALAGRGEINPRFRLVRASQTGSECPQRKLSQDGLGTLLENTRITGEGKRIEP